MEWVYERVSKPLLKEKIETAKKFLFIPLLK